VITVSVKTMEIVNSLPRLNLEETEQKSSIIDEYTAQAAEEV